jgi:hypothetical protein
MPDSIITIAELEIICRQAATAQPVAAEDFRPTAPQIYFFTLVWLLKQKVLFQRPEDRLNGQTAAALRDHTHEVARHLEAWGATITGLKQREAKEWELLRIQMEKALSYYHCQQEALKADALQEALLKIFGLLSKVVTGRRLEETEDMVALVLSTQSSLTNIYDFSSPFYAFAKRIARNELISQLRKVNRQPIYSLSLEDMVNILPSVPPPPLPEEGKAAFEAQLLQLKIDLTRLLELIPTYLTPKPRQVVCQTLAAQPHFWQALALTGLAVPHDFPPPSDFSTDTEIAAALGIDENSVRANRSQAKKRVQELDPVLGLLLERFITRRGGNGRSRQ